jgi:hypothetical protein
MPPGSVVDLIQFRSDVRRALDYEIDPWVETVVADIVFADSAGRDKLMTFSTPVVRQPPPAR